MVNTSINISSSATANSRLLAGLLKADSPVAEQFLAPLGEILPKLTTLRRCLEVPDEDWVTLGTLRGLFDSPSGRGFLQEVGPRLPACPDFNLFFANLRSERRLRLCQEADSLLAASLKARLPDALSGIAELDSFDVYAADGHWHAAAAHDRPPFPDSPKSACGHFYALDLRRSLLRHITAADQVEREHEHDMRALKRQSIEALRQGAPKGQKVMYVYDRAAIDFQAWAKWKERGIYFLSRQKENTALEVIAQLEWEREDPRNAGILGDERCQSSKGVLLRRVRFEDPVKREVHVFLTTEMKLPPGVIAELARRRWNIEKVFDELKNKLGQTKAWATSATAKTMQATFICIGHQLLVAFEHLLESQHGIRPDAELARRAKRIDKEIDVTTANHRTYPSLRAASLRLTQHVVKFIRWLRSTLTLKAPWDDLIDILRRSYATI